MKNNIPNYTSILTAADGNYLPFLAACLYSLTINADPDTLLEITVLYQNITDLDKDKLCNLIKHPHIIHLREVNEKLCNNIGAPNLSNMPANYFRLLAPYIYSKEKQVIYLDADTIILGDITTLATIPLKEYAVGAVLDWLPSAGKAISNWHQLGLNENMPYFNSGVLVMNINKWQIDCIASRAYTICLQNSSYLAAQGKWMQHEQYGINVVLKGEWLPLPSKWNHFTELSSDFELPQILHFVGQGKPISSLCLPVFKEIFKETLKYTPWNDSWPSYFKNKNN